MAQCEEKCERQCTMSDASRDASGPFALTLVQVALAGDVKGAMQAVVPFGLEFGPVAEPAATLKMLLLMFDTKCVWVCGAIRLGAVGGWEGTREGVAQSEAAGRPLKAMIHPTSLAYSASLAYDCVPIRVISPLPSLAYDCVPICVTSPLPSLHLLPPEPDAGPLRVRRVTVLTGVT